MMPSFLTVPSAVSQGTALAIVKYKTGKQGQEVVTSILAKVRNVPGTITSDESLLHSSVLTARPFASLRKSGCQHEY